MEFRMILVLSSMVMLSQMWLAAGHGRLEDPPARSSMWRFGFNTPKNYDDHSLNCGGAGAQWTENNGKCGLCGDNYKGPKQHEVGGKYANGIIVRSYPMGSVMNVRVKLTKNHLGHFEFKLCPNNNVKKEATQSCLDRYPLKVHGTGETKIKIDGSVSVSHLKLDLPRGLQCSQCVLQWTYRAGNNWGDCGTTSGLGCGAQETFRNCADIAITGSAGGAQTGQQQITQRQQWTQATTSRWQRRRYQSWRNQRY